VFGSVRAASFSRWLASQLSLAVTTCFRISFFMSCSPLRGLTTLAAFITCFFAATSVAAAPNRPPNIVGIFADDLGYKDTGFTGSDF
jgi:hypothetical protein